jgi:hypothetical protein
VTVAKRYSWLALALYLTFFTLVCSFILFEVLDVDGSDFPPPSRSLTSLSSVEPSHEVKRLPLQFFMLTWAGPMTAIATVQDARAARPAAPEPALCAHVSQVGSWRTFARASLPDPSAA